MGVTSTTRVDTGIAWQRSVPAQWKPMRLKDAVEGCSNGIWGDEPNGDESDTPIIRVADFDRLARKTFPHQTVRSVPFDQRASRELLPGDLLIEKSGGGELQPVGMVVEYQGAAGAVCSNFVARMRPRDFVDGRFLTYLHAYLYERSITKLSIKQSTGIQNLDSGAYLAERCFLPPLDEQFAIASYLDAETGRIDGLIEEKRRLLDLLGEQKRMVAESVIAPVPAGREAKLGYFVDLLPGFAFPSEGFSQNKADVPLLRGVNLAPGAVRWGDSVFWPNDQAIGLDRFRLEPGDVVFGMDRPWISSGTRVAIINEESAGALLLQRVCRIRGGYEISNRFIYYVLASDKFRQSIEFELSGISVPHISPEQITRFRIPMVSLDEQRLRCDAADNEIQDVDRLINLTGDMIEVLQELRSSTITDAVLGRIDVRHHMKN